MIVMKAKANPRNVPRLNCAGGTRQDVSRNGTTVRRTFTLDLTEFESAFLDVMASGPLGKPQDVTIRVALQNYILDLKQPRPLTASRV